MADFGLYLDAFAGAELRALELIHIENEIYGVGASTSKGKAPEAAQEKKAAPKEAKKPAKEEAKEPQGKGKEPVKEEVQEVTEKVAELKVEEAPAKPAAAAEEKKDDEDDIDLFASDDEVDEEAERIKQERLKEYAAKKSAKPAVTAKSQVILDVKPWDDETNMDELTANVKAIEMDGLLWGAHKLVPVGYGIKKLQITCVVEDEKVSIDDLSEKIAEDEDHVQ
ncbi:EF-1 guanine nucleotide exchange domain-containing protein [Hyaloraphidium curvatum]|nr:EF-1 guanine nucleotide exchange domain-containing protein [Hyaloraphidium curvatum]